MATSPRKILVAPAWPYAAGHRHLGHVAGFGVPSDVFARYHRLRGNDVLMVSGTDEHGTPVMVAADKEGRSYGEVADYYNQSFREDFRRLGLSYDLFSRTTTLNHERVVQDLRRRPAAAQQDVRALDDLGRHAVVQVVVHLLGELGVGQRREIDLRVLVLGHPGLLRSRGFHDVELCRIMELARMRI